MKNAARFAVLRLWVSLAVLLAACGTVVTPSVGVTPNPGGLRTIVPTQTAIAVQDVSTKSDFSTAMPENVITTPLPAGTATGVQSVVIWWPAPLAPDGTPTAATLRDQLARFEIGHKGVTVTVRLKRASGLGGILDALVSGSVVAPTAMPDLTLLRREDLVAAQAGKLIHPIDVASLGIDDLFGAGQMLGKVEGAQVGIPYALEVQHFVFRASGQTAPPTTLDDLLSSGEPLLFPANTQKSVSSSILAQYISAGGRVVDENGAPVLDHDPLVTVLKFYEEALRARVVTAGLLDYSSTGQYWPQFVGGKAGIVQTDSTLILSQKPDLSNVFFLPLLPLEKTGTSGEKTGPVSVIDGWMWVVTTADPNRQAQALAVLEWLLNADRQGELTRKIGVLPSRRSALDTWDSDNYLTFVRSLLEYPAAPLPDTINPVVATELQGAFEDVLMGRKPAESAARDAVAQVSQTVTAK